MQKKNRIINFIYNNQETKIQCDENDCLNDIIKRYIIKIQKNIDEMYFLYNGTTINTNMKLKEMNNADKEIKILAYDFHENPENKEGIKYSKDIICPKCGENCLINISDNK